MQRTASNKSGEMERRRFLQRYMEIAETLGVSLTVEHLLPAINDIVKQFLMFLSITNSFNKMMASIQIKDMLN